MHDGTICIDTEIVPIPYEELKEILKLLENGNEVRK